MNHVALDMASGDDNGKKKDPLTLEAHGTTIGDNDPLDHVALAMASGDNGLKKDPLIPTSLVLNFNDLTRVNDPLAHAALGMASGNTGKKKDKLTSMTLDMAYSDTTQMKDPLGFAALGATFCAKDQVNDPLAIAALNTTSCRSAQAMDPLAIVAMGNPEVCREKKRKKSRQKISKTTADAGMLGLDKRRARKGNKGQDPRYNIFDALWIERPLINCFDNIAGNW